MYVGVEGCPLHKFSDAYTCFEVTKEGYKFKGYSYNPSNRVSIHTWEMYQGWTLVDPKEAYYYLRRKL